MNDLVLLAAELQRTMDARGWRSCIIGGLAVIRWGEPRFTRDVDVSLFTGLGGEEGAARALLEQFSPRISDALNFALENRVLLLEGPTGIAIDIALAAFPFEAAIIDRASDHEYLPETMLRTVSAEDLIVLKAFANRDRDWTDITGIVERQRSLDWEAIVALLTRLVEFKDDPDILRKVEQIRRRR